MERSNSLPVQFASPISSLAKMANFSHVDTPSILNVLNRGLRITTTVRFAEKTCQHIEKQYLVIII